MVRYSISASVGTRKTPAVLRGFWGLGLLLSFCSAPPVFSALQEEAFTFSSSVDGTAPLHAQVVYREGGVCLPVVMLLHGYGGTQTDMMFSARRMAQQGFFSLVPDARGSGGSAGAQDDGGLEVMDVYDALLTAAARFPGSMDVTRVSVIGYSAGGGQAYLALARFPFVFRSALVFFGFPDYQKWMEASPGQAPYVEHAVGGVPAAIPRRYDARNAVSAASNIRDLRLHVAADEKETLCPRELSVPMITALEAGSGNRVLVHISQSRDRERWIHGPNLAGHLSVMEDRFLNDTLRNAGVAPAMPDQGSLVIPGFLVTPRFSCFLGRGDDGVGGVDYAFLEREVRLSFRLRQASTGTPARVRFSPGMIPPGAPMMVDDVFVGSLEAGVPEFILRLTNGETRVSIFVANTRGH